MRRLTYVLRIRNAGRQFESARRVRKIVDVKTSRTGVIIATYQRAGP
jgi:hypothetical protein